MSDIIIIGAGPAGLTAANRLIAAGRCPSSVVVMESTGAIGGISQTVGHNGNRIDIGGHRFFTKDPEVRRIWAETLAPGDASAKDEVMMKRPRKSRIYYLRRFFDYPVTMSADTMRKIGPWRLLKSGVGYIAARLRPRPERSLEDFYINRFGRPLYHMFFEGYTEKVWGLHPSRLGADWGAQRVKGLSVAEVLRDMTAKAFGRRPRHTQTSLIDEFDYPKYGPGQLWETMAAGIREAGASICLSNGVTGIKVRNGRAESVTTADGVCRPCEALFSSMPLKDLIAAIDDPDMPTAVREVASALPYRDFITVGVLLNRRCSLPDNWIYIQERDVRVGRLQILNNWSPWMVADPAGSTWIGMEYFCNEGDEMWTMSDDDFCRMAVAELEKIGLGNSDDVTDTIRIRMPKAYPSYHGAYSRLSEVRDYLDTITNLYPIGRNGQHRYNNMDHSMLTAMVAVDLFNRHETSHSALWQVNTDKDYHETENAPK